MDIKSLAYAFISEHKDVAFATVENGAPRLRVFQVMHVDENGNIWFSTSAKKEVYRQLQQNPEVEILGMGDNKGVRFRGKAIFDATDEMAQHIYTTNPVLPRLYENYKDLVYFRLMVSLIDYYDLTPEPPVQGVVTL